MKSGKTALIILAGVGAGVAIGYWLSSEKSRKLRKKISSTLNEISDDIRQKVLDEFAELKSKAAEMKEKGVSLKDKVAYAIRDLKDETREKILDFIDSLRYEPEQARKDAKQATHA